ncbi:D-3-phosphoglycerate dehydrogenase [Poriferisphaera corsica]|uniref:D-3-phosphoglycerate dehydrogenase n=1 Tax=Poriferisphaera corsica TaxID=2528020 RepID=A0A517YY76_9BACT|nr:NAD(P)-dependent oxidoreductase [Poriferisphaera corsica]QDU35157.1 D-3-phosphoglycerate dehydrogenase [Poriferisphaera corsica]
MNETVKKPMVIVTETLSDGPAAWLAERAEVVWCPHTDTEKLNELLPKADGLVVRTYTLVNEALLAKAGNVKVIGRAGVGLDNFDLDACKDAGVRVVYTPDANSQAVVEYVIALMLDELRPRTDVPTGCDAEMFHQLRKTEIGLQLDQLTLGIVGFGRVGKRLGRVAHAIGMKVMVAEVLPESKLRGAVEYPFEYVTHDALYQGSDIVSVHVDGRAENRHMLNADVFEMLKPEVLLINAARGFLQDNDAMRAYALLNPDARIVLDVHDPEPIPPGSEYPLHGLENVRLLPHIASRTNQALENMSWVVRDVDAVLRGVEPMFAKV